MSEAWIIDAVRTPRGIGKPGKGALSGIHPQKLLSTPLKTLITRNNVTTHDIDDVIIGCSTQVKKQGTCIARNAALDAGFSIKAPGVTLDRFCGSGITAVNMAASSIMAGMEELIVAGGVEMMSYTAAENLVQPIDAWNVDLRFKHPQTNVGIVADIIANEEGFSRKQLDEFAAESQRRAGVAIEEGRFLKSLIPVYREDGTLALDKDENPRPGTTSEQLGQLAPAFAMFMDMPFFDADYTYRDLVEKFWPDLKIDHRHHAGSSSGVVDGASALLLASPKYAAINNLKPRARIRAIANVGHSPEYILNAPVDAAQKVLARAGMNINDIDLFEINEAFACVPLKFMKDLNVPHHKLNVNGGAIALGHPIGATGGILIGTALDELERQNKSTALITMCAAGGMAPAIIIERI